ncbi:MAG: Gfo/Idh/MocA family oxidoreductase [Eubacteriales bacterium]|nr:Gfo/Idh/MocA family oxidoreductase [Eubacteriales bacterium]
MSKVKVAIIGAGNIAQNAHLPVYMQRDDVEIVAIADLNLERAQEAAKKFGIPNAYSSVEELLEKEGDNVECVDVCVWNRSHAPVAIAAAKAGKAVLCEKPLALNLEHALQMEKEIGECGTLFMCGLVNRYRPDVSLVREMYDQGKFGDVYFATASYVRRRGTPIGWFTDTTKSGGGPVIDIGVHAIDRTWYMMGCPKPVRLSANISNRIGDFKTKGVNRWLALDSDVTAFDTEDSAAGVIHFENGATMLFECSWALNAAPREYSEICGSLAGAKLDAESLTVYGEDCGYLSDQTPTFINQNPFEIEIGHFLDCYRTGKQPVSTMAHAVTVQRMLEGIYQSAKLGREVEL